MTPGIRDIYLQIGTIFYGRTDLPADQRSFIKKLCHEITQTPERQGDAFGMRLAKRLQTQVANRQLSVEEYDLAQGLLECLHHGWVTTQEPTAIKRGIYDHFKGGVYRLEKVKIFANGEWVVDYLSMNYGEDHGRFLWEWCEVVQWPDGKYRSRFVYRGPNMKIPPPLFKVAKT